MTWISALPTVVASAALLLVPGLVVGALIRLRGLWLWALAPAISTTLLTAGSVVLPLIGASWRPVSALLFAAVFGAVVVLLFRLVLKARFATTVQTSQTAVSGATPDLGVARAAWWPVPLAYAVGALLIGWYAMSGIGAPTNISQTFDNVFHLNAIALINDTGNASPFEIAKLTSPDGGQGFYPDGWHALVQLAQQFTGATVPVAINAFNVAAVVIVWPLGFLLLVRQLAGASRMVTLAAGVLTAALPAFPIFMIYYGVLYPFFYGLALAPATLAVLLSLFGLAREPRIAAPLPLTILFLGILPAIALAHPGAMMAVLAFAVPIAVVACCAGWSQLAKKQRTTRLIWLAVFVLVGIVLMVKLRPGDMWGARMPLGEAVFETLALKFSGYGLPLVLAALVIVGIVVALRRRTLADLTLLGMWLVGALLYIVSAGISVKVLRAPTGVWYGDAPRLAAIFAIAALPLAVIGAAWLLEIIGKHVRWPGAVQGALLIALLVATQLTAGYRALVIDMRASYTADANSALLTPDEIALLERLPQEVGKDEMIAGSPWTGASLAYAFADRQVVFPHILMNDISKDRATVMKSLRDAATNPAVCPAADALGVKWVLDFGTEEVHQGTHHFRGIENLADSPAFKLVDEQGEAKLYRFVGCG